MNVAIRLCYNGSNYHGWQMQPNQATIQGTLSDAIVKTVKHPVTLYGCGRTDSGVHAKIYVANFHTVTKIPIDRLSHAINSQLPSDIVVNKSFVVADEFNAIADCIYKEYTYYIHPSKIKNPFFHNRALFYPCPVDLEKMTDAASKFVGTHDFAAVKNVGTPVKSTVRTLFCFDIKQEGELISFRMAADGFMYNMARTLVGTVLYINEGKQIDIDKIFSGCDRNDAGPTVPPHGLYMTDVRYEAPAAAE